jgi:membrane fusion protein, adhesin transport system
MPGLPSKSVRDYPNLPPELRDEGRARLARRAVFVIVLLITGLLVWSVFMPIEEVAVAPGELVPAGSVSKIHHLEGGIVKQVLVSEDQRVERGQKLVLLQPEMTGADLSRLQSKAASLKMDRIRLSALIDEEQPDFGVLAAQYPELVKEQRAAHQEMQEEAAGQLQEAQLKVERLGEQISSARAEMGSLNAQMNIQQDQVAMRQETFEKGYTSRHLMLKERSGLEELRQRHLALRGRITELVGQRTEARARLRTMRSEKRSKWAEKRSEVITELSQVNETLRKHRDRMERLAVRSPVTGTLQTLGYKDSGEVIKPGALVAEVVPAEGELLARVELQPRDIGHVSVGDQAEITLSNYDPNTIGVLRGKVLNVSPTTLEDKRERHFYRVDIIPDRQTVDVGGQTFALQPGVTLQVKIKTGAKTLAQYMLKPVMQSVDTAFAER